MGSPDFELCNDTAVRLEVVGDEPTDELYTTIVLAWAAHGAIGDGGFEHLFEGAYHDRDPGYARTLAAYERIGARACAAALREALGWLGDPPPRGWSEREARYAAVGERERERVAAAFLAGQDELERTLAEFIREHDVELFGRGEARVGDLRLRDRTLERLHGDDVVARSFDLREWRAEVRTERSSEAGPPLAVACAVCVVLAVDGGWPFVALAAVAGILAAHVMRPRVWLFLRRGEEEARVGGWDAVDAARSSFAAKVVKLSAPSDLDDPRAGDDDG